MNAKIIFFLLLLSTLIISCKGKKEKQSLPEIPIEKDLMTDSIYDEKMAKQFMADEYGMKQYVMAFLKRGPNRNQDSATAAQLQKGHMANINKMANEGKLVLAGPFMDDGDVRGIYVFNVTSIEEAKALTETDPAIVAGRLVMELHPWYGSAALMPINSIHKKLSKKSI
jgi:uncharacterized protein